MNTALSTVHNLDEDAWDDLLNYIEERRVIPIIGPELLRVEIEGQSRMLLDWLAERLAKRLQVDVSELSPPITLNDVVCCYLGQRGRRITDVDDASESLAAFERDHSVGRPQPAHLGAAQARVGSARGERIAIQREHRSGRRFLARDGELGPRRRLRQPARASRAEAVRRFLARPRQRHPAPVAPDCSAEQNALAAAQARPDAKAHANLVADYEGLHSAVVGAIIAHKYGLGAGKLPTKKEDFAYTLGSGTADLGKLSGANYGLFVMTYDQFASDSRKADVVELNYLVGLDLEEVAQVLDVSLATVNRDLRFARAWLKQQLEA